METPPDFKAWSVVYCHADAQRMPELREIFAKVKFAMVQAVDGPAMVMGVGIVSKPTFALLGSDQHDDAVLDACVQLRRHAPETRVIVQLPVLQGQAARLLEANASGYLCPQATADEILCCLADVLAGRCYLCQHLRQMLPPENGLREQTVDLRKLTKQETAVAHLIVRGLTTKQMADKLCVSAHTVKNHKTNMVRKLGLGGICELYANLRGNTEQEGLP